MVAPGCICFNAGVAKTGLFLAALSCPRPGDAPPATRWTAFGPRRFVRESSALRRCLCYAAHSHLLGPPHSGQAGREAAKLAPQSGQLIVGFVDHPQWGQESNLLEILPPQSSQTVIRAEDFFLAFFAFLASTSLIIRSISCAEGRSLRPAFLSGVAFFLGAEDFFLGVTFFLDGAFFLGAPHCGQAGALSLISREHS